MAGPLKSIRLVIRDEKGTINAYAADMDTREDEMLLGSMRTALAEMDPALFEEFKALMIEALRANLDGADERWRTLAAGVEALDHQARMQARQLVVDTFERLVVYRRGARALDEPRGAIDVLLVARGGTARMLSIDKSGAWLAAEDLSA